MLIAKQLRKEYPGHVALHGLNLEVADGEIYALLGANGAGKSTTVNLFMGFMAPTSGQALINGTEVQVGDPATKALVAYIPENVMLYPHLTGVQNLAFFSGLSHKKYSVATLEGFLAQAGLPERAKHQKVGTYSKGMRQKVGIALALAKQAKALFLDEPTSGLDPLASNEFSQLIRTLRGQGMAILMVTHDLFRAKEAADRIGIMRDGRLVSQVNADEVTAVALEELYLRAVAGREVAVS
jgi:ABC-2 type transport system ATP-binding protein